MTPLSAKLRGEIVSSKRSKANEDFEILSADVPETWLESLLVVYGFGLQRARTRVAA